MVCSLDHLLPEVSTFINWRSCIRLLNAHMVQADGKRNHFVPPVFSLPPRTVSKLAIRIRG